MSKTKIAPTPYVNDSSDGDMSDMDFDLGDIHDDDSNSEVANQSSTHTNHYDTPDDKTTIIPKGNIGGDWWESIDPASGQPYYLNNSTGLSQWTWPNAIPYPTNQATINSNTTSSNTTVINDDNNTTNLDLDLHDLGIDLGTLDLDDVHEELEKFSAREHFEHQWRKLEVLGFFFTQLDNIKLDE
tara:strand:+ start:303 stop:857 length:555 start_codon:yes stop_codon:yes gene_type:complete